MQNENALIFSRLELSAREELCALLLEAFQGAIPAEQIEAEVSMSFTQHIFAYHFFVGRENGGIVCAGALKKSGLSRDLWGIAWIAVPPQKQKQGYGRRMVEFLLRQFADEFLKGEQGTIILSSQQHTFAFYEALGFASIEVHEGRRIFFKLVNRISRTSLSQYR